jgi:hypothetical protein
MGEVKKVMNVVYHTLQPQFVPETLYDGLKIRQTLMATLRVSEGHMLKLVHLLGVYLVSLVFRTVGQMMHIVCPPVVTKFYETVGHLTALFRYSCFQFYELLKCKHQLPENTYCLFMTSTVWPRIKQS